MLICCTIRDVLAVRLLPFQDPRPFTYKTWFDWEIPNFCMRLGLDGFNGGSYMEFEVVAASYHDVPTG